MIKTLITNVLLLIVNCVSYGQPHIKAVFRINEFNAASAVFFKNNPNIKRIVVDHKKGRAINLAVFNTDTKDGEYNPSESYVLNFDGDVHILNKKYPEFPFSKASELLAKNLLNMKEITEKDTSYLLRTTFRPDSLTHFFEFYSTNDVPEYHFVRVLNRPFLKQKISAITDTLEKRLQSWKPIVISDSIIVMSGTVETNGTLTNLELLEGKASSYSDKIMQELIAITVWWPVRLGQKAVPWAVKISLRVNQDSTLKLETL